MRHHAGTFMAQDHRTRVVRVVHLVELRMTDTTRMQLHDHLVGTRVREFDFVHNQGLAMACVNCR